MEIYKGSKRIRQIVSWRNDVVKFVQFCPTFHTHTHTHTRTYIGPSLRVIVNPAHTIKANGTLARTSKTQAFAVDVRPAA